MEFRIITNDSRSISLYYIKNLNIIFFQHALNELFTLILFILHNYSIKLYIIAFNIPPQLQIFENLNITHCISFYFLPMSYVVE